MTHTTDAADAASIPTLMQFGRYLPIVRWLAFEAWKGRGEHSPARTAAVLKSDEREAAAEYGWTPEPTPNAAIVRRWCIAEGWPAREQAGAETKPCG